MTSRSSTISTFLQEMVSFYNALLVLDVSKILDMSLSILSTFPIFKAFKIILLVLLISVLWITLFVTRELLRPRLSALRALPGPEGGTFLLGHLSVMCEDWHKQMIQEYGHVIRYKVDLGKDKMFTTDIKALSYILDNPTYHLTPQFKRSLGQYLGSGLGFAEGDEHRRQRRIISPAFGVGPLREMTSIFVEKALELRSILLNQIPSEYDQDDKMEMSPAARVDILPYISHAVLDMIGLAGFNYEFNSLRDHDLPPDHPNANILINALARMLNTTAGFSVAQMLRVEIPILRYVLRFDQRWKDYEYAGKAFREVTKTIIEAERGRIKEEAKAGENGNRSGKPGSKSKDLMSVILRTAVGEDGETISDKDAGNQIPAFILSGHETTATNTTWLLFSLANDPSIQTRLREEIRAFHASSDVADSDCDHPTMDQLDCLPYLDAVVKEGLRFHSVFPGASRMATKDDVIPVEKPYVDRYGVTKDYIAVSKGDTFFISIHYLNTSEEIWGPDAKVFNPDRWQSPPKEARSIPSVWGNQASFLGGRRPCIAYRFAVVEMKAILYTLINSLEFELAVPKEEIIRLPAFLVRPSVKSELHKGNQMPMYIRRAPN